jgi:hypothetical protein
MASAGNRGRKARSELLQYVVLDGELERIIGVVEARASTISKG